MGDDTKPPSQESADWKSQVAMTVRLVIIEVQKNPNEYLFGIVFLFVGLALVIGGLFYGNEIVVSSGLFLILAVAVVIFIKFRRRPDYPPLEETGDPIRVIGWQGVEKKEIYDGYEHKDKVACLVGMRSFENCPRYEYIARGIESSDHSTFDIIVCDIEFLHRYLNSGAIKAIKKTEVDYDDDQIYGGLRAALSESIDARDQSLSGVPIQFGFMEMIMNESAHDILIRGKPAGEEFSYKDVCVHNLLEHKSINIGLWGWYLPTFCHILLSLPDLNIDSVYRLNAYVNADEKDVKKVENAIRDVAKEVEKNIKRFKIYEDPAGVRNHIIQMGDKPLVVIGGSSALLAGKPDLKSRVKVIIPKEGLLIWVNCCALLSESKSKHTSETIKWLYDPKRQIDLTRYDVYKGCPVDNDVLEFILRNRDAEDRLKERVGTKRITELKDNPATSTIENVFGVGRPNVDICVRPFPNRNWGVWADSWEVISRAHEKAEKERKGLG